MDEESFEVRGRAGRIAGITAGPDDAGKTVAAPLPVLLVHGINMSRDVWREVAAGLARESRVVTIDLRGHGASDRQGPFGAEDYADDVLAVMDDRKIARAHVVGTSFGGSVACTVAVRAPERVASIAAFGSALAVEGLDVDGAVAALRGAGVRAFFSAFLPRASFAPGTEPALIERALDAAVKDRDLETVIAVSRAALGADLRATGAAVRAPALVVTGELDATCPVAAGAEMARTLRTGHHVISGRGHVITLEDPHTVADLVAAHARAHDARS